MDTGKPLLLSENLQERNTKRLNFNATQKRLTMKGTRNLGLLIVLGLILIFGVWGCSGYNGLVSADQNVKKVWGNVETNYQRRTDLYNSVIKTIEGSANFEKSLLKDVVEARARATSSRCKTR